VCLWPLNEWRPLDAGARARHRNHSFASWYTDYWFDEPLTLRAFASLLSVRRFFSVADGETLEALFADSANDQQEVTDQLGHQVRRAVENPRPGHRQGRSAFIEGAD
jgi:hypothetical protein